MPAADTAYIVGVIRERERGFLGQDEYTRLTEAGSFPEAVRVLAETPYGPWLVGGEDLPAVMGALADHLADVHRWLGDAVLDIRIWQFISARYDALNIARALLMYRRSEDFPADLSVLGAFNHDTLQSTIWHGLGWEGLPAIWADFIRAAATDGAAWPDVALVRRVAATEAAWREQLAVTPLMRAINAWLAQIRREDDTLRPLHPPADATALELDRDGQLLQIIQPYRLEPVGYDPIIAFWYGKELEVKSLRLLLAAKANQRPREVLASLRRPLYRSL